MVGAVDRGKGARTVDGGERVPVPVGRSCSLERNYPLRDRDEAANPSLGAREATNEGGGGVVFTRHGCCWCCAVVAPSARAPVPFFVYCCPIERTDEPVSKHARRSPRMVRRNFFLFPIALRTTPPRDTCRCCCCCSTDVRISTTAGLVRR